jgi:polyhydroxyalkanoate synthesis repressor PhaR
MLIKKYGNRRLYDTQASRYITLEELTQTIRGGAEVQVVDAKTGEDLTQSTLTQVIIEGRGAGHLLPAPLLHQLIRLGDDMLAEFLGRYVQVSLELYLQAKQGMQAFGSLNPFGGNPFFQGALAPFANAWSGRSAPEPTAQPSSDVAQLKRELDELKKSLGKRRK